MGNGAPTNPDDQSPPIQPNDQDIMPNQGLFKSVPPPLFLPDDLQQNASPADGTVPLILTDENNQQLTYDVQISDLAQFNNLGGKWLNLRRNLYGYNSNFAYRK